MSAELQRCRDEQIRCATLLLAGHPEQHGLRMGLADWMMEEVLLLTEQPVTLHTESDGRGFESLLRMIRVASLLQAPPGHSTPVER